MGTAKWQPKWWTEEHTSTWGKVKDALHRDWEQTKKDLHLGGQELDQNVSDTVKQASGKEAIPAAGAPNTAATPGRETNGSRHTASTDLAWDDAEQPLMYGYGARKQYGAEHARWNDNLETRLKSDWESSDDSLHRKWEDVKHVVRHGYDRARS